MHRSACCLLLLTACVEIDDAEPNLGEVSSELGFGWCNDVEVPVLGLPLEIPGPGLPPRSINVEEPFVRVVGSAIYLYFSDRAPNEERDLHYAIWTAFGFQYQGPLSPNTPTLMEGAPSIDYVGHFFFTSSTAPGLIARGSIYGAGLVYGVTSVPGMPPLFVEPNGVTHGNMDIGVAPIHPFAILSRAVWLPPVGGLPFAADLLYLRRPTPTTVSYSQADTDYYLRALNTPNKLEYAAELSFDGLHIFYTQTTPTSTAIMTAWRAHIDLPFGPPLAIVPPMPGQFFEAPTVTPQNDRIFYHRVSTTGGSSKLRSVQRCP